MTTVYTIKSSRQNWKEIQNAAETTTCFEITSKELRTSEYFLNPVWTQKSFQRHNRVVGKRLANSDLGYKNTMTVIFK
jgi:hypothetical protein